MRSHYAALVAIFLDSVNAVNFQNGAERSSLGNNLEKRAKNTTVIPVPINVEPSQYWDGNDGPWSSFPLQVGRPKQNIRVMVSTAGFNVWTVYAKDGCPNGTIVGCENSRGEPFFTNESLTWVENSIWQLGLEQNLGLDSTAYFGFDEVTLGWQGSGLPTVERTVISNFAIDTFWLGLFGLNPMPTNFSTFNDPQQSFMQQLKNNNTIPSLSWSYTAGNRYRFAGDQYGSLVLGGYDQSKFTPTNVTTPFGSDVSRDLLIGVQSITTTASSTALSTTGFYAFIDSTVPHLWLPLTVCEAFEKAFGLTWDEDAELYLVNNTLHTTLTNLNANVTLTLGPSSSGGETVDITLPYSAFDLQVSYPIQVNTSYYFPLKRAANATQYTLGRTFLQEAYIIADYERRNFTVAPCAWVEDSSADLRTIYSTETDISGGSSGSGIGAGAIAGIVVGVVAVIALLCLALWFLRRKKQGQKKRVAELEAKSAAAERGSSDENLRSQDGGAGKPLISHPIGGELGSDGAVHEMQAHQKTHPVEMDQPYGTAQTGRYDFYNGDGKDGGTLGTGTMGGVGTWQSGLSEVEGNNEPIYEMPGSDVQELPDSRRQSWADGDENTISTKNRA